MLGDGDYVKRQVGSDPLEQGLRHDADFYRTGEVATRALLMVERFPGVVWEPACGAGDMSRVLERDSGVTRVISTDLHDRGYGTAGVDFLSCQDAGGADHVVTNPPFRLSGQDRRGDAIALFARQGLRLVRGRVALVGRLQWLEGSARKRDVFDAMPPARVWVFPYRIPMARGESGQMQAGLVAFCWFIWDRTHVGPTHLGWLPRPPAITLGRMVHRS